MTYIQRTLLCRLQSEMFLSRLCRCYQKTQQPDLCPVSQPVKKKKNTNTVSALFCHHGVFMHSFMLLFFYFVITFLFHFELTDCSWLLEYTFHSMLLFSVLVFIVYSSRSHEVVHNKACHCK